MLACTQLRAAECGCQGGFSASWEALPCTPGPAPAAAGLQRAQHVQRCAQRGQRALQVVGRKRMVFWPPDALDSLSLYPNWHLLRRRSRCDPAHPNFRRFPKFQQLEAIEVCAVAFQAPRGTSATLGNGSTSMAHMQGQHPAPPEHLLGAAGHELPGWACGLRVAASTTCASLGQPV